MSTRLSHLSTYWQHFVKYRPLIRELVSRDLKVKYRRSFLGYVWSILNPLLMMILQTIIFSYMFRSNIENYPLYLICGNTLFNFFNESTNMGMGSVLLDHAEVGEGAIVAAGSVVLSGTKIPPYTMWAGVPAKQVKAVPPEQTNEINRKIAHNYAMYAGWYDQE